MALPSAAMLPWSWGLKWSTWITHDVVLCRLERGIFAKSTQASGVPKWQVTSGVEAVNDSSPFKATFSGATANGERGRCPVGDDTQPRVVFFASHGGVEGVKWVELFA